MTTTANPPQRPRPPLWQLGLRAAFVAVALRRRDRWGLTDEASHASEAGGDKGGSGDDARANQPGRGRDADSPTKIPTLGWKDIAWRVYAEINNDRILAVAAGVTFYSLLAIFPAIAAFVSIYGLLADPSSVGGEVSQLSGILPGGAVDIISEQVTRITSQDQKALGFAFVFSLALALWSSNSGVKAMIDALNVAYGEAEKRGFFTLNFVSLCFTAGMIVFLVAALTSVVIIPVVLNFIGLGGVTEVLIKLARWPLIFAVLVLALSMLYRFGPSRRRALWRWVTPGSLVAAVLWLVVSILFSWYVSSFGSYNETYGSLGAVIGMMTWIWLSVTVVLLGAEMNAEIEHQTAKDSTVGGPKPLGSRGAAMADAVGPEQAR